MPSRRSKEIEKSLLGRIASEEFVPGSHLPSIRELADEYEASTKTIHKVLQIMFSNGLIEPKDRASYRVLAKTPLTELTFAFLVRMKEMSDTQTMPVHSLNRSLQKIATERGCSIIFIPVDKLSSVQLNEKLIKSNVSGVILNEVDKQYRDEVLRLKIPAITLDVWNEYSELFEITRDEYQGAYLSADLCVKKGAKHFAWLGHLTDNPNAIARYGAICGLLAQNNLAFQANAIWDAKKKVFDIDKFLSNIKPNTAIFSFWAEHSIPLVKALQQTKLKIGRDVEVVRWSTIEDYESNFKSIKKEINDKCITAVWSVKDVAQNAMDRLEEIVKKPHLKPFRVCLPMWVKDT